MKPSCGILSGQWIWIANRLTCGLAFAAFALLADQAAAQASAAPETRSAGDRIPVILDTDDLLKMEQLGIHVTDEGYTVIDETAKKMTVATEWKDLAACEDFLVERLTGP